MNTESQSNTQIFQQKKATQARIVVAVVILIIALGGGWLLWRGAENEPTIVRVGTGLFVLFVAVSALGNMVIPLLFSKPLTLSITDEGVMASNWSSALRWSEIGRVKVLNKKAERIVKGNETVFYPQRVLLVFYSKSEPEKAVGEVVGFNFFENGDAVIAALNNRLEQPVIKEGF